MPTIFHRKAGDRTFSSDANNDSTGAFNHESVAIWSGVGFTTRDVCLEQFTVREKMEWQG